MRIAALRTILVAGSCWLASAAPVPAQDVKPKETVSREAAEELYGKTCQACHGPSGTGSPLTKGSAFLGRKWKHGSRQADVVKTITNGVPGTMMLPFKDRLSPDEIAALASLVRSYGQPHKPARLNK